MEIDKLRAQNWALQEQIDSQKEVTKCLYIFVIL